MSTANQAKGPVTVSTTADLHAAGKAGHTFEEITIATPDTEPVRKEAHAAGLAEGRAAGAAEATTVERARIAAIQAIAQPGFEKEIAAAIESGATADATAGTILRATKDKGITLGAIVADASVVQRSAEPTKAASGWDKAVAKMARK